MVWTLQKFTGEEIKETKSKVKTFKRELTILKVDHNFLDQRLKHLENTSHQGNEEGTSFRTLLTKTSMNQLTL